MGSDDRIEQLIKEHDRTDDEYASGKERISRLQYAVMFLALAFMLFGFFLIIEYGVSHTGYAVIEQSGKVESDVIEDLKEGGEARVIIVLEENEDSRKQDFTGMNPEEVEDKIREKKEKVKEAQKEIIDDISERPDKKVGIKRAFELTNALSANVTKEGIEELIKNNKVKEIIRDRPISISLSDTISMINADDVHQMSISGTSIEGQGISVCVIDTGVAYTHSAFGSCANTTDINDGSCQKVVGGYDFVNEDFNPLDDNGHGTHVAGIIASEDAAYKGIAPKAGIVAIKSLDSNGSGFESDVASGIEWCISNSTLLNISVISMSLGEGQYTDDNCPSTFDSAINAANALGIMVVAASGNNNNDDAISSPACSPNVTSVGAVTKTDSIPSFSNSHPILDLLAPGVSVVSAVPPESYCTGDPGEASCSDSLFMSLQGTSMATPHAAGAAALIYQYEKLLSSRNATPSGIERILKRTGISIDDTRNSLSFPRIDVLSAVNAVLQINESENSVNDAQNNARVVFRTGTDLERASEAFIIEENLISLNSSAYPEFNKPADLILYNLDFAKTPVVLKDGVACAIPDCNVTSYDGNLSFSVAGFSNYTSGANAKLSIFDEVDNGTTRYTHENITFYANYTNMTSGDPISTAVCNITFDDMTNSTMTYESSTGFYNYTREFLTADLYHWNVSCEDSDAEPLNTTDDITVLPGCGLPPPGIDWNISDATVNCNNENLYFQNQSLIVQGNSTLILNNSLLTLNQSPSDQNITIMNSTKLIAYDSRIQSQAAPYNFDIIVYGNCTLFNVTGNQSQYHFKASSSRIQNSAFQDYMYFEGNSAVEVYDSVFNGRVFSQESAVLKTDNSTYNDYVFLMGSSDNTISNSAFNSRLYFDDASVTNFTTPGSLVSAAYFQAASPAIYGHADMPDTASFYQAGTMTTRHYPIQINYTSGNPVNRTQVNITNSSSSALMWTGYTDENGLADAVLKFSSDNYTENLTVSVNPSENISLMTDTPMIMTLPDPEYCGDGIKNGAEQCDGSDLGGASCADFGFDTGTLGCTAACNHNTAGCSDNDDSGSGSRGGFNCEMEWVCSEWSGCIDGKSTRNCTDMNKCTGSYEKIQEKTCHEIEKQDEDDGIMPASDRAGEQQHASMPEEEAAPRTENPGIPGFSYLIILPIIFLPLLLIGLPRRVVFAEEEVLKRMISKGHHKRYSRIHVTEDVHQRYSTHPNIMPRKFDPKNHGIIISLLKTEYGMEHELAELTAIASRHLFATVLTNKEVPDELKHRFRRIRFRNPVARSR
ncbi:S8 family serine peptidase [Candidatus Woesearchaeota archaeon]|nr:S8 family serine peptidase [Candidatus Woesearchaeota archaeon]